MTIGQDQFLQHANRCIHKLGNGDLPMAELSDSIHIPPEIPYEIIYVAALLVGDPQHLHLTAIKSVSRKTLNV